MTGTKSILVVDDVPEILLFFERLAGTYRTTPIQVTTSSDPAGALKLVKERDFDVVVSDFRMPKVNGMQILAEAHHRNPGGRRVLMTGYNEIPATDAEIEMAGVTARLKKPVKASFLLEFLQACFSDDPHALDAYATGEEDA